MDLADADPFPAPVERADIGAARRLAPLRDRPAVRGAAMLAQADDQPPLLTFSAAVAAGGLLAGDVRLARRSGYLLASVLTATAPKAAVKRALARTRPNLLLEGLYAVEPLGPDERPWHSFPSGHTAGAVTQARACACCWPAARLPAYAGAVAVRLAQVPRGAHYPSDVLAGALVGAAAQALAGRLLPPP